MKKKIYIQPILEEIKLNAKSVIMSGSNPAVDPTSSFSDEGIVGSREYGFIFDDM